jgi:transcriptional regulator with XRE-family HTH domain
MTPAQLTKALKQADLSQSEAARRLGIDPRTMRRYIAGDLAIPLVAELALRYVIEHKDEA